MICCTPIAICSVMLVNKCSSNVRGFHSFGFDARGQPRRVSFFGPRGYLPSCVECSSTQASSARNGTRTLRPILTVGRTPPAIISYAVALPTLSLVATSSARSRSFDLSGAFSLAKVMSLLYSSVCRNTKWR